MMGRFLRVGVIGLGVGQAHAIAVGSERGCEVAGLCDRSLEKRRWAIDRFPKARVTDKAQALIEAPDIDAVVISSYDDDHADQIREALKRGKHVFVEKPLCQTFGQFREIEGLWRQYGGRVKLHSNLVLRAAPLYIWLKKKVLAGHFGNLFSMDGDYLYGRLRKITQGWRGRVNNYSVLAGGGIHLIDLIMFLSGQRPHLVWAKGNRVVTRGSRFRYLDFVAMTMIFPSGLIARVTSNFGCVHGHQHVVRLFGAKRTFIYDDAGPRMQSHRDPAPPARPMKLDPLPAHKGALIPGFVRSILGKKDISDHTQSLFDTMRVVFAGERSLATGRPERVNYL